MQLALDVMQMLVKYTTSTPQGTILIVKEDTPPEVIETVEDLNDFYLKNHGREFIKIQHDEDFDDDEKEEKDWTPVEAAAQQGDVDAQFRMGERYWRVASDAEAEDDEARAMKECVRWYKKAALQGHIQSMLTLGEIYECGIGGDEDCEKAEKWYKKAAGSGDITGMHRLADLYSDDGEDEEAAKWFRKAAELGDADSQYRFGMCCYNGIGIRENKKEAFKFFKLAAEQDHAEAQCRMGMCYSFGDAVERDFEEAFKWYTKAAEKENAEAQFRLGLHYAVEENHEETLKWYKKAVENGHKDAKNMLSQMLEPVIVSRKPTKCPVCGSRNIKTILYDMPGQDFDFSKYIVGGCCVHDGNPSWGCDDCAVLFVRKGKSIF